MKYSLIKTMTAATALVLVTLTGLSVAENQVAGLRGDADLNSEGDAPRMERIENKDLRRERAYPQQPPTIPHEISNYQVDRNFNKCLTCHSRKNADNAQAPMVSVTHFQDREGQFLVDVTPARYFCNQCHVPQLEVKPVIENTFIDVDTLVQGQ